MKKQSHNLMWSIATIIALSFILSASFNLYHHCRLPDGCVLLCDIDLANESVDDNSNG